MIMFAPKKNNAWPLVSVALVTFRQRHLLNACLESIFSQDYPNIELIICDDASCDFDIDEVSAYVEREKGDNIKNVILYKHPSNVGTVNNCQKAFELSKGTYLKLQAGDDMFASDDSLSSMVDIFEREKVNLIFSRARGCQYNGELTNNLYPTNAAFDMASHATAEELFELIGTRCWGMFVNAPAVFWRRSFLEKMGGFDLSYRFTEDWPMWLKVCASGEKPRYVDQVTVLYRYGGISNNQPAQNGVLAEAHYKESARMLRELALPRLKEKHSKWACLKCIQAAKSIEERATYEIQWSTWNFFEKLWWKIKNIPFFALSFIIQAVRDGIHIPITYTALSCAILLLLYNYNVSIYPTWNSRAVWGISLAVCGLVFFINLLLRLFVSGLSILSHLKKLF